LCKFDSKETRKVDTGLLVYDCPASGFGIKQTIKAPINEERKDEDRESARLYRFERTAKDEGDITL